MKGKLLLLSSLLIGTIFGISFYRYFMMEDKEKNNISNAIPEKLMPESQKTISLSDKITKRKDDSKKIQKKINATPKARGMASIKKPNEEWYQKLESKYKSYFPQDTPISIIHVDSKKQIEGKRTRLVKIARIETILNGEKNSFMASVDAKTGKIIDTWNRNKYIINPKIKKQKTISFKAKFDDTENYFRSDEL